METYHNDNISTVNNPQYFGAYLNMARHNMFLLVNRLTEKFKYLGFQKLGDDEEIADKEHILYHIFNPDKTEHETDRFKVYKFLVRRHYLPFIKIFHEKLGVQLDENPVVDYENLHKFLTEVFTLLSNLRNSYSHHLALDENGKKISTRKPVISELAKEKLRLLFEKSPEFSFERFSETQTKENFEHLKSYPLLDGNHLNDLGFYFFTNLFLERKYASKFLKKIRGFKSEATPPFRATLQAFTAYCVTVPDERLGNEDRKQSLLMEMMNELQRCPKALYRLLSEDDKKIFEPQIETKGKSNILLNSTNYEDINDEDIDELLFELTTLKRHDDRFPYFALRFMDVFDLLPNIRFQIVLGKLQTKKYGKTIGNETINRRIIKQVNAFGKLSDFEDKEEEVLKKLGVDDDEIYFDQFAPHYNMENNKIPFYLFGGSDKIKYPLPLVNKEKDETLHNKPTGFISVNDLPKIALLAVYSPTKVEEIIQKFLDDNSNLILNFTELEKIKNKLKLIPIDFTRRIIDNRENAKNKEYIELMQKRRDELQNHLPSGIEVNQLPEQVLNYLLNISNANAAKLINAKIKAIHYDCEVRIKKLSDKKTQQTKDEKDLKKGAMATFLTRDIIDMVIDKNVKQRITNVYVSKLQSKMALFNLNKTGMIEICEELNILEPIRSNKQLRKLKLSANKKSGHVFLTKELINNSNGVIDFYQNYLEAKIKWIEKNLAIQDKKIKYALSEGTIVPYTISKFEKQVSDKDFKIWLKNKSKMPVELPNTLFGKIDNLKKRVSDTQPFYYFNRVYKQGDDEVNVNIKNLTAKKIKAKYGNRVNDNEKAIRFTQTQDRVLKLLCKYILSKEANDEVSFSLDEMMPFAKKSVLNGKKEFKQKIDNTDYWVVAKDNAQQLAEVEAFHKLTTDKERVEYKGQRDYEWTVKDFGRFRKLLHDRRLKGLLAYFENKDISYHFIEYQLAEYDKYREKIFDLTFELEKQISSKHSGKIQEIKVRQRKDPKKNFNEVDFDIYIEWLNGQNILNADELKQLKEIRNKFSHTQFPNIEMAKLTTKNNEDYENGRSTKGKVEELDLSICKKVYDLYEELCKIVLEKL